MIAPLDSSELKYENYKCLSQEVSKTLFEWERHGHLGVMCHKFVKERFETLIDGRVYIIQLSVGIDVNLWQISRIPWLETSSVVRHVESVENTVNVSFELYEHRWAINIRSCKSQRLIRL